MGTWIKILAVFLLTHQSSNAQMNSDSELKIYKKFLKAGTSNALKYAFRHPEEYADMIDTTNINVKNRYSYEVLLVLLNNSKCKAHRQTKISGIELAGEFKVGNEAHYFVICAPDLMIDLTLNKNYWISKDDQGKFRSFIDQGM